MNLTTLRALGQIRNASKQKLSKIDVTRSTLLEKILPKLHSDGFIYGYERITKVEKPYCEFIRIQLKYLAGADKSRGLLDHMDLPTTLTKHKMLRVRGSQRLNLNGYGIINTSRGLLTTLEAKRLNIGGVVLLSIRL